MINLTTTGKEIAFHHQSLLLNKLMNSKRLENKKSIHKVMKTLGLKKNNKTITEDKEIHKCKRKKRNTVSNKTKWMMVNRGSMMTMATKYQEKS